ncbi:MAG: sodium-dependent transporter [Gammaproteobacteria bacterium]|nr:sodium-dependent transporter [Gammaproteobacteria bacterium]
MDRTPPHGVRPQFASRMGMLLTVIGVAVGLGNVWRFPYMMGSYGGSAFLLVYLLFTLLLAVPVLSAEWALGRSLGQSLPTVYVASFGRRWGGLAALLLLITVLVADSYYLLVIAQIIITAGWAVLPGFSGDNLPTFQYWLAQGWLQYSVAMLLLLLSLWIIGRGLNRGIEAISRIIMPAFALIMIYLLTVALALPGAVSAMQGFLKPDFAAMNTGDVFAALGQAFFSLGLGGTFHVVYGSYVRQAQNLPLTAMVTAGGDVLAALLAALFIVPVALVFSLDLAQGPGLIFDTLPRLFMRLPDGGIVGAIFLLALAAVALLSNIAALQVAAAAMREQWPQLAGRQRSRMLLVLLLIEAALMLPSALDNSLIGTLDLLFGSGMQLLGGLFAVLALLWGLQRRHAVIALFGSHTRRWHGLYLCWLRWVVPLLVLGILAGWLLQQ